MRMLNIAKKKAIGFNYRCELCLQVAQYYMQVCVFFFSIYLQPNLWEPAAKWFQKR